MSNHEHGKFPHDRIVYFSDAVFAIAITLLVIEIKVPSHEDISTLGVGSALKKLIPLFIGYFVSFIVSALFWKSHLQLARLIKAFDSKLLWFNIFLLLFVALMPFSTALYSENFGSNTAFTFYSLNLFAIGLMNYMMHRYVGNKESLHLTMTKREFQWFKGRALIGPVVFLLCIPLAYASPWVGRLSFLLIFVIQIIGERFYAKKVDVES